MSAQLNDTMVQLKESQEAVERAAIVAKALEERARMTPEWQTYEAANRVVMQFENRAMELDDQARALIMEEYVETGNKHPHPATTVRIDTAYDYDQDEVLAWLQEHRQDLVKVSINATPFKKAVREGEIPGVTTRENPVVVIETKRL